MHIAMHAVGKITLFFCAGAIMVGAHKTEISTMDGLGRRMPIVPEMRAIWDVMRPALQNVMNGETTPAEAAQAMQEDAIRKIAEMQR